MNFAEKTFNLRKEIIDRIKEIASKYGVTADCALDAYGYHVNDEKRIDFVNYNSKMGLRFDTGYGNLEYQSAFTIEELANLADQLEVWYNDNNIKN